MLHPANIQGDQSATLDCTDFVRQGLNQMKQRSIDSDEELDFSGSDSDDKWEGGLKEINTTDDIGSATKPQLIYSNQSRHQWERQSAQLQSISGGATVHSEAISRKSIYRKRAKTIIGNDSSSTTTMSTVSHKIPLGVNSKPFTAPKKTEPEKQFLRPKNKFNGVYFPCFAGVCGGVLAGTAVFPLPPKQEKVHFLHAISAPLDHLDGQFQPDSDYLDDIACHMKFKLESWEYPNRLDYLDRNGPAGYQVFEEVSFYLGIRLVYLLDGFIQQ